MNDRYDDMIRSEFGSRLDDIHASEDLILKTLAAIEEECSTKVNTGAEKASTLTALNQDFVAEYITKSSRRTHLRLFSLAAVAAICAFSGVILMMHGLTRPDREAAISAGITAGGEQVQTVQRKIVPEENSIVPLGHSFSDSNYFTPRSISNRPIPRPDRMTADKAVW